MTGTMNRYVIVNTHYLVTYGKEDSKSGGIKSPSCTVGRKRTDFMRRLSKNLIWPKAALTEVWCLK